MKPLLLILRTKLVLLSFLFTSTVVIATTITLEIKHNNKEVITKNVTVKKEKKKNTKKVSFVQRSTFITWEPALTTDAADYAPGTTATLTGTGFLPNEMVRVQVLHANYVDGEPIGEDHEPWEVQAGSDGSFVATWHVCEDDCVGETLRATADGLDTNPENEPRHAEVLFTDSPQVTGVSVSVQSPNPVTAGNNATYTVTITRQDSNDDFDAEVTISGLPSGITSSLFQIDPLVEIDVDENIISLPGSSPPGSTTYEIGLSLSSNACNTYSSPINFTVKVTKKNGASEVDNDNESGNGVLNIINDNVSPTINATGTTLELGCNPSAPDIINALGTATATDACLNTTILSNDGDVVSNNCSRSETRTFTATDGAGNTATISRTITWTVDTEKPGITLETAPSLTSCNPSASDISAALGTASATDACGTPTVTFSDGDVQTTSCGRSQTRTFTARDACENTSTISRTVSWTEDNTPPQIVANGTTLTLNCNPSSSDIEGALGSASATDGCGITSITPTDGDVVTTSCSRSRTRTFTVIDGCGNTNSTSRTVTWTVDKTSPTITAGGTTLTLGCNPSSSDIDGALGTASATDGCSTATVVTPSDGTVQSNNCSRSQKRTFTAIDGCGNTATTCRTVTWTEDNKGPTLTTGGTTTSLGCNPSASDINAALGTATATDACSIPTVITPSDGNVSSNGCTRSQKRTFTARDACGNTSTACRTITWTEDNTAPTFTCTFANTTLGCNPASSAIEAGLGTANATDACGSPTVTASDAETGTCIKSKTRKFTARDGCGNTATASRTVTWKEDTGVPVIPPTFVSQTCLWPPNHKMVDIVLAAADGCGVTGGYVKVTSSEPKNDIGDGNTTPDMDWTGTPVELLGDPYTVQGPVTANADGTIHILLRAERSGVKVLNPDDPGRTYTVYFTATDACGNTASASVSNTVTVAHNITNPKPGCAYPINTLVNFSGTFWDIPANKHTAKWIVDGTSVNGTVTSEPSGNKLGKVTGSYKPTVAGVYKLRMNVTDQKGVTSYATTSGDYEAYFVAYDPKGGYTFGAGQFTSPLGALTAKPTLASSVTFGFASNYYKNATNPKGETELGFKLTGDGYSFEFNALNYDYLAVNGSKAQYKGLGKTIINGVEQSGYAFLLTVIDGKTPTVNGVDKIRMKIYNKNTGAVIYDNQMGAPETVDPTTPVDLPKDDGSDIVVVSGTPTSVNSDITRSAQMESVPETGLFKVTAHPNPTEHQFTLYLEGGSNEKVQLIVYDAIGRQVKKIEKGDGSGPISFGENLKVGIYIVEVRQGANRKTLKLIKQ